MPATRTSTKLPAKRPATRAKERPRDEDASDIEVLSYAEDGLTLEAKLFGEATFVLSTDINAHTLSLATKSMGALSEFFHRQISIDHLIEGKTQRQIDTIAWEEKKRFDDLLSSQQGLNFERYGKLFADLIEAFGNEELGNDETST